MKLSLLFLLGAFFKNSKCDPLITLLAEEEAFVGKLYAVEVTLKNDAETEFGYLPYISTIIPKQYVFRDAIVGNESALAFQTEDSSDEISMFDFEYLNSLAPQEEVSLTLLLEPIETGMGSIEVIAGFKYTLLDPITEEHKNPKNDIAVLDEIDTKIFKFAIDVPTGTIVEARPQFGTITRMIGNGLTVYDATIKLTIPKCVQDLTFTGLPSDTCVPAKVSGEDSWLITSCSPWMGDETIKLRYVVNYECMKKTQCLDGDAEICLKFKTLAFQANLTFGCVDFCYSKDIEEEGSELVMFNQQVVGEMDMALTHVGVTTLPSTDGNLVCFLHRLQWSPLPELKYDKITLRFCPRKADYFDIDTNDLSLFFASGTDVIENIKTPSTLEDGCFSYNIMEELQFFSREGGQGTIWGSLQDGVLTSTPGNRLAAELEVCGTYTVKMDDQNATTDYCMEERTKSELLSNVQQMMSDLGGSGSTNAFNFEILSVTSQERVTPIINLLGIGSDPSSKKYASKATSLKATEGDHISYEIIRKTQNIKDKPLILSMSMLQPIVDISGIFLDETPRKFDPGNTTYLPNSCYVALDDEKDVTIEFSIKLGYVLAHINKATASPVEAHLVCTLQLLPLEYEQESAALSLIGKYHDGYCWSKDATLSVVYNPKEAQTTLGGGQGIAIKVRSSKNKVSVCETFTYNIEIYIDEDLGASTNCNFYVNDMTIISLYQKGTVPQIMSILPEGVDISSDIDKKLEKLNKNRENDFFPYVNILAINWDKNLTAQTSYTLDLDVRPVSFLTVPNLQLEVQCFAERLNTTVNADSVDANVIDTQVILQPTKNELLRRYEPFGPTASYFSTFTCGDFTGYSEIRGRLGVAGNFRGETGFSIANALRNEIGCINPVSAFGNCLAREGFKGYSLYCEHAYDSRERCLTFTKFCQWSGDKDLVQKSHFNELGAWVDSLVVDGTAYWSTGRLFFGNMRINQTSDIDNTVAEGFAPGCGLLEPLSAEDGGVEFKKECDNLNLLSKKLSRYPTTGSIKNDGYGTLTFESTGSRIEVFTITGEDLKSLSQFVMAGDFEKPKVIIINVLGEDIQLKGANLERTRDFARHFVWNFHEAILLNVQSATLHGTILAPQAKVNTGQGIIKGQLFVKSFDSSVLVDVNDMVGELPCIDGMDCCPFA